MLIPALLAAAMSADDSLPVRAVTVFKDGHALVVREGERAVTNDTVRLDGLPEPLLGSFGPYATDEDVRLVSATAGRWTTDGTRDVNSLTELLAANVGRSMSASVPAGEDATEFVKGEIKAVLFGSHVRLAAGDGVTLVLPIADLRAVKLTGGELATQTAQTEPHVGLSMRLDGEVGDRVGVGLLYVQPGFRWIPQYRMTIADDGTADMVLRATLVNDLIDLEAADVNLVVGVPTFAFKGQKDPIALNVAVQELASVVPVPRAREMGRRGYMSNAISSQAVMEADFAEVPAAEVTGGSKSEDLYVYSLRNVTLKKGERMSIEVARSTVEVSHRYAVDLPVLPPAEANANVRNDGEYQAAARRLSNPVVSHTLRVKNTSDTPLTTAPVLLFEGGGGDGPGQLLAQAMQTYTPPGGTTSVDLGTAVDVAVRFDEEQTGREAQALRRGRTVYDRVNLKGAVTAVNRRGDAVSLRVRRYVPGGIDAASGDGSKKTLAPYSAEARDNGTGAGWWARYMPPWYFGLNPVSRAEWTLELGAGGKAERTYEWHYFWN